MICLGLAFGINRVVLRKYNSVFIELFQTLAYYILTICLYSKCKILTLVGYWGIDYGHFSYMHSQGAAASPWIKQRWGVVSPQFMV